MVDDMEKLGVDTSSGEENERAAQEKAASAGSSATHCPRCSSPVEKVGNVLRCPSCGTAPFEGRGHGG